MTRAGSRPDLRWIKVASLSLGQAPVVGIGAAAPDGIRLAADVARRFDATDTGAAASGVLLP